jgi:hypothetical protein
VNGATAQAVVKALGVIADDGSLFVVCSNFGSAQCGMQIDRQALPALSSDASTALWNALVNAGKAAGRNMDGVTVVNALTFLYNGETLAFNLVTRTGTPPPPPAP